MSRDWGAGSNYSVSMGAALCFLLGTRSENRDPDCCPLSQCVCVWGGCYSKRVWEMPTIAAQGLDPLTSRTRQKGHPVGWKEGSSWSLRDPVHLSRSWCPPLERQRGHVPVCVYPEDQTPSSWKYNIAFHCVCVLAYVCVCTHACTHVHTRACISLPG